MKKHNFYAGPSILSEYTIKNTADAILNFADTGLSVLEVSHRSKGISGCNRRSFGSGKRNSRSSCRIRSTLAWRGASLQFAMIPYNLLVKKAAYLDTGTWASNAIKEARLFGDIDVVASSKMQDTLTSPRTL